MFPRHGYIPCSGHEEGQEWENRLARAYFEAVWQLRGLASGSPLDVFRGRRVWVTTGLVHRVELPNGAVVVPVHGAGLELQRGTVVPIDYIPLIAGTTVRVPTRDDLDTLDQANQVPLHDARVLASDLKRRRQVRRARVIAEDPTLRDRAVVRRARESVDLSVAKTRSELPKRFRDGLAAAEALALERIG